MFSFDYLVVGTSTTADLSRQNWHDFGSVQRWVGVSCAEDYQENSMNPTSISKPKFWDNMEIDLHDLERLYDIEVN